MRGRPIVQSYVQLYRGDDIWQRSAYHNDQYKVKYMMYLYNAQFKHFMNTKAARDSFLKELNYLSMKLNWDNGTVQEKQKVKCYRRR